MVMDIFSSQDSSIFSFSNFHSSIVWLHIMLMFLFFSMMFWLSLSRLSFFYSKMFSFINNIFSDNLNKEFNIMTWGMYMLFFSLFFFIFFLNYSGLMSYIFSYTVHMLIVVPMGFSLWLSIIIFLNYKSNKSFIMHLIPYGIPLWLSPFMLIIETISSLVRPITLSVRLMANIGAGHIIMHLISMGCVFSSSMYFYFSLSFIIGLYIMFEMLISMIQSLIFFTLLILYISE